MKIALLGPYPVQTDPSAGGPPLPGGVDAVVVSLAQGLARCPQVELHVITAVPGLAARREYHEHGYTVHAVARPHGGRLTGQKRVVANLCAELSRVRPDIVHAHIAGVHARAALASRYPAVITLHGIIRREMEQAWPCTSWPMRLRWLVDARFEDRVVAEAGNIISISPYIIDQFRGRSQARFHTVENPVADRFFNAATPPGGEHLLCVARVIPRKGIATLVQAFGRIARARPEARLTIVGEMTSEPAYATTCRQLAQDLRLARRVAFLGALTPDKLASVYAGCDLFVLASEQETAPVSIAEAMASSRPVLTTAVGGCAFMVSTGPAGYAVEPGDAETTANRLADAAIDLLSHPIRLEQMGAAAYEQAQARFRLEAVVGKTLEVYERVRAESGQGNQG